MAYLQKTQYEKQRQQGGPGQQKTPTLGSTAAGGGGATPALGAAPSSAPAPAAKGTPFPALQQFVTANKASGQQMVEQAGEKVGAQVQGAQQQYQQASDAWSQKAQGQYQERQAQQKAAQDKAAQQRADEETQRQREAYDREHRPQQMGTDENGNPVYQDPTTISASGDPGDPGYSVTTTTPDPFQPQSQASQPSSGQNFANLASILTTSTGLPQGAQGAGERNGSPPEESAPETAPLAYDPFSADAARQAALGAQASIDALGTQAGREAVMSPARADYTPTMASLDAAILGQANPQQALQAKFGNILAALKSPAAPLTPDEIERRKREQGV